MNHLINRDNIPLYKLVFIGLFLIVSLIFIFSNISYAGDSEKNIDGKLITIHDRGESKVIVSRGVKIGDAINDAGIEISEKDSVEPAIDQKMIASEYQVNIYRARPVIVIDGAIRRKIVTPYQTADQIAKDAGVVLFDEDRVDLELSDSLVDGAGLTLLVKRSTAFNFDLYGKNSVIRTQATTVGEMLQEKNIKMSDIDHLSLSIDTKITDGLSLRLWREGKQTITVEEVVKFESDKIEDGDQPVSYSVIKVVGENGTRNATYEVTIINGQESSRQEIASIITKQPKKQVEVIGTKATTPDEARIIGHRMMLSAGFGEDQWVCLNNLWNRESMWRVNAINKSSGAYGIPQSLPASKMKTAGEDYLTSAETQISWGLSYIKNRYGSPCGAWSKSESVGWY